MAVYKDEKRGTYFVRIVGKDAVTGARYEHKKRGFKTKREAKEYEAQYLLNAPASSEFTFSNMHRLYLSSIDATETNKNMQLQWCAKYFSLNNSPIDRVTRADVLKWRELLQGEQLATRTKNRGIRYVKAVFNFADKVYGIPDVTVILKPFKLTAEDKEEANVWTVEEFNTFLECVPAREYKLFFDFLFWTGCRRGEALALQYTDIKKDRVSITKAIKHYKNGFMPLKTDGSKRTIRLDSALLSRLQPNIADCNKDKPFLFGGATSLSISQVQRYFAKGIEDAGVKPIRIHDLRHSHATLLINSGVNIVAVSKRLGHSSINQTLKTYTHLLKNTDDELINTLEKLEENT